MAINPAMSAGVNIQANYAVTSSVNTYDTPNVWNNNEQTAPQEEGQELQQQQQTGAQQEVSGSKTAQTSKSTSAQQTQQSGQAGKAGEAGGAGQAENGAETSETAARTLRLAMADNSKELQAKFNGTQTTREQPNMSQDVRRQVMLRNMENMVNLQLAQYTGNEPYSKANYREILGAVTNMQNDGKAQKSDESKDSAATAGSEEAGKAEEKDGVYKLYSGQAAKTLASLNSPKGGGDDSFDLVA